MVRTLDFSYFFLIISFFTLEVLFPDYLEQKLYRLKNKLQFGGFAVKFFAGN